MDAGAAYVFDLSGGGPCDPSFDRGDCNADGTYNIADAINALNILFAMGGPAPCDDACDSNDDGGFDISDAVYVLTNLFSMGPEPEPPFGGCGADPTSDALTCAGFPPCP